MSTNLDNLSHDELAKLAALAKKLNTLTITESSIQPDNLTLKPEDEALAVQSQNTIWRWYKWGLLQKDAFDKELHRILCLPEVRFIRKSICYKIAVELTRNHPILSQKGMLTKSDHDLVAKVLLYRYINDRLRDNYPGWREAINAQITKDRVVGRFKKHGKTRKYQGLRQADGWGKDDPNQTKLIIKERESYREQDRPLGQKQNSYE